VSKFTVRVEKWNTRRGDVVKYAVRDTEGKFHGATNFPLSHKALVPKR